MTSKKVSDIRRMKISKTDRKDKKTHADQDKTSKNIKTEILECIIIWQKTDAGEEYYPKKSGNCHTIYMKFSKQTKNGTIQRIFEELQGQKIIDAQSEVLCLDSTNIKVHPNASGATKKQVVNKALDAQKEANNEGTRSLCI